MEKRQPVVLLCIILCAIAGCGNDPHAEISIIPAKSITPTYSTITLTSTYSPTTSAIPDFDPIAATFTILPPEECPTVDPQLRFYMEGKQDKYEADLLTFLNAGGTIDSINDTITEIIPQKEFLKKSEVQATDLTGDGVFEIIVWLGKSLVERTKYFVFGCTNGQFVTLFTYTAESEIHRVAMPSFEDLNGDGVKEIISEETFFSDNWYGFTLSIIGWDGTRFSNLIEGELFVDYPFFPTGWIGNGQAHAANGSYELIDIDGNGTTEVVIASGWWRGESCLLLYRDTKLVLMWNGHGYSGFYNRTPAVYRIQAVWDGDEATLHGRYEIAVIDYTKAIDDEKLLAWSPEFIDLVLPLCRVNGSTPLPENPVLDEDEWPRIASYSYYRIVLLHIVHGNINQAQIAYDYLQSKYPRGSIGFEYAQMAKSFWDEYKIGNNIGKACQGAIAYADLHPEQILAPLGRPTYGPNHGDYESEDICPFK